MTKSLFTYKVSNEFIDSKETVITIFYCGREIGTVFPYLGNPHVDFSDSQPMVAPDQWQYLGKILHTISTNCANILKTMK